MIMSVNNIGTSSWHFLKEILPSVNITKNQFAIKDDDTRE